MLPRLEQGHSCAHGPLRTLFVLRSALCTSASPTMSGMSLLDSVLSGWLLYGWIHTPICLGPCPTPQLRRRTETLQHQIYSSRQCLS